MPKLVVIADDLTGANDTGVQFSKLGLRTTVLFGGSEDCLKEDVDIIVFDTDSRSSTSLVAHQSVNGVCSISHCFGIRRCRGGASPKGH